MASWSTYVQGFVYIALLFFFIPIKINGPDKVETQFQQYLQEFNKTYDDPDVYQAKLQAFKLSLQTIDLLNSNKTNGSAQYGLTKFSDLLPEEFISNHLHVNLSQKLFKHHSKQHHFHERSIIPDKVDWREKHVVTKVHDQGTCGACWAYAVVETIESINAIKINKTDDLSVQEIIDCAGNNNNGCDGGDICTLLSWIKDTNLTLMRQQDYLHKSHHCGEHAKGGVNVENFICESFVGNEPIMLRLLAENGPLAVAINAQTWQNYIGGVIEYHCDGDPAKLNHAVQVVGYDLTAGIPHYIVRNSWGEDFGDGGYLYLAVDKNMCGLANEVSALTVL